MRFRRLGAGLALAVSVSWPTVTWAQDDVKAYGPVHTYRFNSAGQVDWTGFYAGVHSGGVTGKTKFVRQNARLTDPNQLPGGPGTISGSSTTSTAFITAASQPPNSTTTATVACPAGSPAGSTCTQIIQISYVALPVAAPPVTAPTPPPPVTTPVTPESLTARTRARLLARASGVGEGAIPVQGDEVDGVIVQPATPQPTPEPNRFQQTTVTSTVVTSPGPLTFINAYRQSEIGVQRTVDIDGFHVGPHIGYQVQRGNIVLGGDIGFSVGGGNGVEDCGSPLTQSLGVSVKCESEYKYSINARARLGYATGNWLFYLTGGVVKARLENSVQYQAANGLTWGEIGSAHPNGWLGGLGFEYVTANGMRLGLSYTHIFLNDVTVNLVDPLGGGSVTRTTPDPDVLGAALKIPLQQQQAQVADPGPPAAQAPAVGQGPVAQQQATRPATPARPTPAAAPPARPAATPPTPAQPATTAPAAPAPRAPVPGTPKEPEEPAPKGRPKK